MIAEVLGCRIFEVLEMSLGEFAEWCAFIQISRSQSKSSKFDLSVPFKPDTPGTKNSRM